MVSHRVPLRRSRLIFNLLNLISLELEPFNMLQLSSPHAGNWFQYFSCPFCEMSLCEFCPGTALKVHVHGHHSLTSFHLCMNHFSLSRCLMSIHHIQDPGDAADDEMYNAGPSPQGIYIPVLVVNPTILCWFVAYAN